MKQRWRGCRVLAVDFVILALAGIFLGIFGKIVDPTFGVNSYIFSIIASCKFSYPDTTVLHLMGS
jgi:hypothetical protein